MKGGCQFAAGRFLGLPIAYQNCRQTASLLDAQLVLMGHPVDTRRGVPHGVLCLLRAPSACVSVQQNMTRCMLICLLQRPIIRDASDAMGS